MTATLDAFTTAIIPTLRYSDVPRAIDWLCEAFGFAKHLVIDDEDGGIVYAELTIGASMIMVGPAEGSAFDGLMKQPDQIGGLETQICYLYVADAEVHRARAVAAGAEIVLDIDAEGYTGRGYSCRDPEGHIWNFGTYNPWATLKPGGPGNGNRRTLLLSSLLLLAPVALGLMFGAPDQGFAEKDGAAFSWTVQKDAAASDGDKEARGELAKMRAAKEASERALRAVEEQLVLERNQHLLAGRSLQEANEQLAKERTVVASISSAERPAIDELERERAQRLAAERAVREIREQLQQARNASQSSERALTEARAELAKANAEREAVEPHTPERVGKALRAQLAKREASKPSLQARMARYRAARLAARARVRRLREAREPYIKPPLPYF
ncbi:MAG TPA: VOC family protein [Hyphomicrobiaceae bacterium]|nr:VOC family protein [Hyphomicrobiaceae bacterium]